MPQIHAPPDAPPEVDPVKAALEDPEVRRKLRDTALACLGKWKSYPRRAALEHDAEDIVAEAQATAMRRADSFDASRASVKTWTQGIVRNLARKLCGRPHQSDLSAALEQRADGGESPQDRLIRSTERDLVHGALATLDPADRELIRLHYFEYLSPSEVAARLDISAGNARTRLCRLRKDLYAILSPSFPWGRP